VASDVDLVMVQRLVGFAFSLKCLDERITDYKEGLYGFVILAGVAANDVGSVKLVSLILELIVQVAKASFYLIQIYADVHDDFAITFLILGAKKLDLEGRATVSHI